jgi:flagellar basal body rod protein FlgG
MIDTAIANALDRIAQRAVDAQRAFTPGASPRFGDVASAAPQTRPNFDPLSAAPPDGTYFVTRDARGRTLYTRDGGFALRDGMLTLGNGDPALGLTEPNGILAQLRIDPVDAALGRVRNARIETDGSFAYERAVIDPRSGLRTVERVVAGRLALARFPAATAPNVIGADRLAAPPGVVPHVGAARDGNFAALTPMARDGGRVDFNRSLEALEEAYIAFDALQAAHKAKGSTSKTAMDLLK